MAGGAPFSEKEVHEIGEVVRDFLLGGGPSVDTEPMHRRWSYIARLVFLAIDKEKGSLLHLPCDGPVFAQPAKTLAVYEYVQSLFVEHMNKLAKSSVG